MSKSISTLIKTEVQNAITSAFGTSVPSLVTAVSGGVDSMCLLHVFRELEMPIIVAHINYQKRGKDSDKDARLVAEKAGEYGFDYHILKADPDEAKDYNFQHWARMVRYRFFRDLAVKSDADGIALAHHRDDQVETILQKLLRGAGMSSWSGMKVWDGELFRPLLNVGRKQIERYAEEQEVSYRTDASNLENDFARNFIRNQWGAGLSEFFPGWQSNILRLGEAARNYTDALQWIANAITDSKGIKKHAFDELEAGLQRALVLHLLKQEKPGIQVSQQSLHRVDELSKLQTGKEIEITSGFSMVRDRDYYVIKATEDQSFSARTVTYEEAKETPLTLDYAELGIQKYSNPNFEQALYLDVRKISWPVTVRTWQPGDRLQPLGMDGHQTVAEHLTNRKISTVEKEKVLVIESFEETICALIFPPIKNQTQPGTISELVKCDSETEYCLRIKHSV